MQHNDLITSQYLTQRYLDYIFQGSPIPDHSLAEEVHRQSLRPKLGDHIYSDRKWGVYTHHGIYVGNDTVVHYSGMSDGIKFGPVVEIPLSEFQKEGNTIQGFQIQAHPNALYSPDDIVKNAYARIGEEKYHPLSNNCEHFVYQCIYDESRSDQAERFKKFFTVSTIAVLGRLSPHVQFGIALKETREAFTLYIEGKINTKEFAERITHTTITSASIGYYGMLGQVAIPIGGVGFLVGASIGFIVGNVLLSSGLLSLGDSEVVKQAKARRQYVHDTCVKLKENVIASRQQLIVYMDQYFSERQEAIGLALNDVENALSNGNTEQLTKGLTEINHRFGCALKINSFTEFDEMMESDEAFTF